MFSSIFPQFFSIMLDFSDISFDLSVHFFQIFFDIFPGFRKSSIAAASASNSNRNTSFFDGSSARSSAAFSTSASYATAYADSSGFASFPALATSKDSAALADPSDSASFRFAHTEGFSVSRALFQAPSTRVRLLLGGGSFHAIAFN